MVLVARVRAPLLFARAEPHSPVYDIVRMRAVSMHSQTILLGRAFYGASSSIIS